MQTVAAGYEQEKLLREECFCGEVGLLDRKVDDRSVEEAGQHVRDEGGSAAFAEDGVHHRMKACHFLHDAGREPFGCRSDHADTSLPGNLRVEGSNVRCDVVEFVEDASGPFEHTFALVGETSRRPVDQGDTEFALEFSDMPRYVRLDGEEGAGSGRETAVIGDRHEGGELPEIHLKNDTGYRQVQLV